MDKIKRFLFSVKLWFIGFGNYIKAVFNTFRASISQTLESIRDEMR